jgi:hypothetical protein
MSYRLAADGCARLTLVLANPFAMLDIDACSTATASGRTSLQAEAYGARLKRVVAARAAVEQRLHKRLDLLDGYARVVNMIEIEARCPALKAEAIGTADLFHTQGPLIAFVSSYALSTGPLLFVQQLLAKLWFEHTT